MDTLTIVQKSSDVDRDGHNIGVNGIILDHDKDGKAFLVSRDVRVNLKKSKDSMVHIEIRKNANGSSFQKARETAGNIDYSYEIEGNTLVLNDFLTYAKDNKMKNQEVRINLYLPVGMTIAYQKERHGRCWTLRADNDQDMDGCDFGDHLWKMNHTGELVCQDCPDKVSDTYEEVKNRFIMNKQGINIDVKDKNDSFTMKLDSNGLELKANDSSGDKVDIEVNSKGVRIDS